MSKIFIGTEAVTNGVVSRHELARWCRLIYPNVHAPRQEELTLRDRTIGAWLWSKRRAIVTGVAASALHGAEWVDATIPIELIYEHTHPYPPAGIAARNERIADDEITWVDGPSPRWPAPPWISGVTNPEIGPSHVSTR